MKKIMLWKILALVIAALVLLDTLVVFSFVSNAAESVEVLSVSEMLERKNGK